MLTRIIIASALTASSALALSPTAVPHDISSFAKRALAGDADKAQSAGFGLAASAADATRGGGACSKDCSSWVKDMSSCSTEDSAAMAKCACDDKITRAMNTCATCLGGDAPEQAATFANLCSSYAEMDPSSGVSSTKKGSAATSSASSTTASASQNANATKTGNAPGPSASSDSGAGKIGGFGAAGTALGVVAIAMLAV
ncbi:hypothetical protein JCM3770_006331 [Rhodotorula araucariae]